MRRVFIKNCATTNMYLSIDGGDISSIGDRINVSIRAYQRQNSQLWDIKGNYETSSVSIHSKIDNFYALNANTESWNCDVYEIYLNNAVNNEETELTFEATEIANRYRIKQTNHLNRYLTATGTSDGSNVIWDALSEADTQIWELKNTLVHGCDTADPVSTSNVELLKSLGYQFIGRYLDQNDGAHSALDIAEATRISNAEMYVLSLYEPDTNLYIETLTNSVGVAQANDAITLATAINQTPNTYIFFAVESPGTETISSVEANQYLPNYLAGLQSVFSNATLNPKNYKWGLYSQAIACRKAKELYPSCHTMKNLPGDDMFQDTCFEEWDIHQYIGDKRLSSGLKIDVNEAMPTSYNLWSY